MNIVANAESLVLLSALILIITITYVLLRSGRKINFNYQVAEGLHWYYSAFDLNLKKEKYLFFKALRLKNSLDGFSGVYQGMEFRLFEKGSKLLAVEFRTKQKFYGIELVSKSFLRLRAEGIFWKNNQVSLEGVDFNKEFSIYSIDPRNAYYELSPDEMAKLLDLRQENEAFGLELHANRALIYSHYPSYVQYCGAVKWNKFNKKNAEPKEKVLMQFMEFAYKVQNVLK